MIQRLRFHHGRCGAQRSQAAVRVRGSVSCPRCRPYYTALTLALLDAQTDGGFLLKFERVPRELRVRAGYLSRVGDEAPLQPPPDGAVPRAGRSVGPAPKAPLEKRWSELGLMINFFSPP